ncbi:MAG: hypothetical protein ACK47S_17590 [Paracoccaceae bacterium]|jgi:hypothetical protein
MRWNSARSAPRRARNKEATEDMRVSWNLVTLLVWLPVFVVMSDTFGGGGSIVAFLLLPMTWLIWVNLREHWWRSEDRDDE